jgi:hypothetical protein
MEAGADSLPVEAGTSVWMQYMLFRQRTASASSENGTAVQATRKVFMQVLRAHLYCRHLRAWCTAFAPAFSIACIAADCS